MKSLPIDDTFPALRKTLSTQLNIVLHAPTGAGKTTRVPLSLRDEPWLVEQRIVMLEPRRLAARAAARHMAALLDEPVGATVGYRTRFDTRIGRHTRIEVVTEGVLTRLLQDDPELAGYGIVIFDEFHERSLQGDLGLALALDVQNGLRPDLRLLIMSATLPGERLSAFLGNAPLVESAGRRYPVDIHYLGAQRKQRLPTQVAVAVERALEEQSGGVLAFLPGAAEIRKTEAALAQRLPRDILLAPLYGALPPAEQDKAIAPTPKGRRRVVLATNIAETSLTIEDVGAVVDAGLARMAQFEPQSGMTRLVTAAIARDSAEQRAGRAGRTAPGVCYRLWREAEHKRRRATTPPEIVHADLAPLVLELARWGVNEPSSLRWLDPPPAAPYSQARDLLVSLDVLDEGGRLTSHGKKLSQMPAHPRLAHMMLRAAAIDLGGLACWLAALMSEQDIVPRDAATVDLRPRLEALAGDGSIPTIRPRVSRVTKSADQLWARLLRAASGKQGGQNKCPRVAMQDLAQLGLLVAFAYPDRVAMRRKGKAPRYKLSNGRGVAVAKEESIADADYMAVVEMAGSRREARVLLAARLKRDDIETHFADHVKVRDVVEVDKRNDAIVGRRERRLGKLALDQEPLTNITAELMAGALTDAIYDKGSDALPWTPALRQWQQRVAFLGRQMDEEWPAVDDASLMATLKDWLTPYLAGLSRLDQLETQAFRHALTALLTSDQQFELDWLAPSHVAVPSGSRVAIDYGQDDPVLPVRLQEMFGCETTPTVVEGKVPLTIHLLSPAQRPVQITQDLAGFWSGSYHDVKKDMKGRYPKHPWPDDPLSAEPTRHVKRRKQ